MRIALIGDVDTYGVRGLARPPALPRYLHTPGIVTMNLLRGFRELGVTDLHLVVVTPEVKRPVTDDGPWCAVHRLPCPKFSGASSFYWWRRQMIFGQLRRLRPAIVHGQGTEREYALTASTCPYPGVITLHGLMHDVFRIVPPPLFSLSQVQRLAEKVVLRTARHVICISRFVEQFLRDHGNHARCYHIPNPVAPRFFELQPLSRAEPEPVLLFVGTVYPRKGLMHLVEALPLLQQRIGRRVRLQVLGTGVLTQTGPGYEAQVRQRAQELGVATQVEWLGARDEAGVCQALTQADVLVLPSLQETTPMCIAEAMAAGVAVVATRVGGVPEMIEHGATGLLVEAGRVEELAGALGVVLTDTGLRQRMTAAAREQAALRYSPRAVATQTLAAYDSICQAERALIPASC